MLELEKNDALTIGQLAKKAAKKIPLYEKMKEDIVKVPFLDIRANKERFLRFRKFDGNWTFIEIVD